MKIFQFGAIRPHPAGKGTVGEIALHVQCPWRLVRATGIVTGSADYYEPAVEGGEMNLNDGESGNLQRRNLRELFQYYDAETRSLVNNSDSLMVISVESDCFGRLDLKLSGGVDLQVFPDGTRGEQWRLFLPGDPESHFVQTSER
jgi:hypothetical protein